MNEILAAKVICVLFFIGWAVLLWVTRNHEIDDDPEIW